MPFMWLLRPSMAAAAVLTIAASCSLVVVVISLLDDVDVLSLLSLALALALALVLLVAISPIGSARLLTAVVGPAAEVLSAAIARSALVSALPFQWLFLVD